MADEYFKKRSGTTDRGKDYEDLFISYIILHLILDDDVKDFQISSNDENFGAFDDIVVEIEWTNQRPKDYYALQLKHSTRPLTLKNLTGKTGDFSVKKYYENFMKLKQESYKWVLLTNRKFNYNERDAVIRLEGDDFDIKIVKYEAESSFLMFCRRNFYQFRSTVEDTNIYEDFFQKFYLSTEQLDVVKIETQARNKFAQMFLCGRKIFDDYYKFITDWSLREGRKIKLNRNLAHNLIAINLLSPYLKVIPPLGEEFTNSGHFRDAILKFHISFIEEYNFETLREVLGWSVQNFRGNNAISKEVGITGGKYQLNPLDNEDSNKIMFLLKQGHLVVTENQSVYKALALCEDKNCIILCKTKTSQKSGFRHLVDLKQHPKIYREVLQTFTCNFQGKNTINLEELIDCIDDAGTVLSTTDLLQMVQAPLGIGGPKEETAEPYIKRSVSRLIIDYKFVSSAKPDTLIIIICDDIKLVEKHINVGIKTIDNLITGHYQRGQKSVFFGRDCPRDIFNSICLRFEGFTCHQFRIDNEKMEWVRSRGSVSEVKKFLLDDNYTSEEKLIDFEDDINLICGEAGMGKTTSLRNFKNHYTCHIWTILIYPKDHSKYFREKGDDIHQFLSYVVAKNTSSDLDAKLLTMFLKKKRINFLWDGLDETSEESLSVIVNIIGQLRDMGYKQWLTSRNTLLEQKFDIIARKLRPFDEEEQRNYIRGRLKCSGDDLEDIFAKISRNMQLFRHTKILAIPLQIYMFTHLLITNLQKYRDLLDKIFSLTDLYQCFVEEKFSVLHQEKENFDGWNDMVYKRNLAFKKDRIKQYQNVAINSHFPAKFFDDVACEAFLGEMKVEPDSVGIITHVTDDNVAQFWHTSYGEYFAALYLSKHLEVMPRILNYMVATKYTNIRFFFDLMMAKGQPAHLAVLYKNFPCLQACQLDEITSRDGIGRNPLQVACSWGEQFPDLHPEKITWFFFNHKYRVYGWPTFDMPKENVEYLKIVEFLAQKNDPKDVDDIFGFDSFSWADQTYCLTPLEVLAPRYPPPFDTFDNLGKIPSLVYYCALFDLPNLLQTVKEIPIVEDELGESVIHTAVKNGSLNCLTQLLSVKYYENIKHRCKNELLELACDKEHQHVVKFLTDSSHYEVDYLNTLLLKHLDKGLDIVEVLVDSGAQVNLVSEYGYTVLLEACISDLLPVAQFLQSRGAKIPDNALLRCCVRNPQIILLLIENGAKVTVANTEGTTPIHHASHSGYFETVKILADNGANLNDVDKYGCTPLHMACRDGRLDVVEKLVGLGADLNVVNHFGFVPLHYACGQKHYEIVEFLVREGADVGVIKDEKNEEMLALLTRSDQK